MNLETLARETSREREFLLSVPVIRRALAGEVSRELYIRFLTQAYHHVRHTVPLFTATAERLPARHDLLREALAHYIAEEDGHDVWILDDISEAGGDSAAAMASEPAIPTAAMVAYAWDTVLRGNPVGFFGMVHVLEGTSVSLATRAAGCIQAALELPSSAFTYLRSHGELDKEHVGHLSSILERFTAAEDCAAVTRSAKAIYWLYGHMFRGLESDTCSVDDPFTSSRRYA
jgi:pyrroloquinoline quinone (PQQ) biosynthesis protein C